MTLLFLYFIRILNQKKLFILPYERKPETTGTQELSVILLSLLLRKGEPAELMSHMSRKHNNPHINSILVVLQYIITCKWILTYYKNNYPCTKCFNRFIVASDQGSNLVA